MNLCLEVQQLWHLQEASLRVLSIWPERKMALGVFPSARSTEHRWLGSVVGKSDSETSSSTPEKSKCDF